MTHVQRRLRTPAVTRGFFLLVGAHAGALLIAIALEAAVLYFHAFD